MAYHLDSTDIGEPVRLGRGLWWRSRLPEQAGDCAIDMCRLDDSLALAYAQYRPRHDLLERSRMERESRSLTITLGLEGQSSTISHDGQRFDFMAGHSTLAAFTSVRGERRFPANRAIRQLRLIAGEALLCRYHLDHLLDDIRDDHSARHVHFGLHNVATQRLAHTLVHLHRSDASLLDLQVAALGLLAEQTRTFQPKAVTIGKLREDEEVRLFHARDILMRDYAKPITVAWLCATVGINEFTLKQGFRKLFNTSPHRLLTDIRMRKAHELLETGPHVSIVAYQVGYQHLSSFSAAFQRYYGYPPKSVAAPRKQS
ncbi:helix-turn-helix transcriptional regulator [Niveispirillum irakense]|uniref:helix-turn-helix transcriptional regulator n=1 Tax=Niveispirillum irakense TaxID=34011 RepID=UPI0003F4E8C1|nr:response regulator transcription factor [Niveispirillum irakense]